MSSDKVFYIVVGFFTFLIFAGIIFFASKPSSVETPVSDSAANSEEIIGDNPNVSGDLQSAKIVIVEFSDFQCPACKSAWSGIVLRLKEEFPEDVAFVYRHFPLNSIHNYAFNAAKASEAAALQGSFWEYHDELFKNQGSNAEPLTEEDFVQIASDLGLNTEQFTQDYKSKEVEELVREDSNFALSQGLNSTPTFYVNGEKYTGGNLYMYIEQMISNQAEVSPTSPE